MIENPPLPPAIEQQLEDLVSRHKRHQEKMEYQRVRKIDRRTEHRNRHFIRSVPPNTLV